VLLVQPLCLGLMAVLFVGLHTLCIAGFEMMRIARAPGLACVGLVAVMLGGAPTFYIPTTACFGRLGGPFAGALYSLADLPGFLLASWCFQQ